MRAPLARRPVVLSVLLAAAAGAAYLIVAPVSADLAAATFRAGLFSRHGWLLWSNEWYGGHHLPAYSVLFPPLGSWLGVRLLGALAVTIAAGLFATALRDRFSPRAAMAGSLWFALGAGANLFTGRVPFLFGFAVALGVLVAVGRERPWPAVALALLAPLASPVDGAFVALGAVAWALGAHRRLGSVIAAAAFAPVVVLTTLFPEGGTEPSPPSAFWPAGALLALLAVAIPREHASLRIGCGLYAAATLLVYVVPTPVGGNVVRLGALCAGPVIAAILVAQRRPGLLALVALPLAYWQLAPAVHDVRTAHDDPSTKASYYEPLLAHLPPGGFRLEVPFTRVHWEAALLAPRVPLARGWERQLDRKRNALFYGAHGPLTPRSYRQWLLSGGVRYVALPDVRLDPSALAEARIIRDGGAGLRLIWRGAHWRLYEVVDAEPLVSPPATLVDVSVDSLTLRFDRPGRALVRFAFSPHWAVVSGHGCVSQGPKHRLLVRAPRAGLLRVGIRFAPWRAVTQGTGERCS